MTGRLGVSVALGTYNGAAFLEEQLASLANQSLLPTELVISDDASSDSTIQIIHQFARDAPFPVKLTRHAVNLGVVANFNAAFGDCSSEFVAPCDQDDTWERDKLEVLVRELEENPGAAGALGDARLIGAQGEPVEGTVWERVGFTSDERSRLQEGDTRPLLRGNVVSGARLVFRRQYLDLILPMSTQLYPDYWMAMLMQVVAGLVYVNRILQTYRVHGNNLVGLSLDGKPNWRDGKNGYHRFSVELVERLEARGVELPPASQALLQDWVAHNQFRASLPRNVALRTAKVLGAARRGDYRLAIRTRAPSRHYTPGPLSLLTDNWLYRRGTMNWMIDVLLG
jgi:glycosyltransferase involved in cell wall biosynthesis